MTSGVRFSERSPSDRCMARAAIVLLSLVAAMPAGCSAIVVQGSRTTPTGTTCDQTYIPPAIDVALAAASAALVVYGVTSDEGDSEGHTFDKRGLLVPPSAIALLVFGISSAQGFKKVARCKHEASRPALVGGLAQ